jgi:hypothetical protein
MPQICVRIALALVLVMAVASPATSGTSDDPKPLCEFVSSSENDDARAAATVDATQAKESLRALRKAAKLSLPGEVDDAIKKLIPIYRQLASGDGIEAIATLNDYATNQCAPSEETVDACELVTHEEAEALAGTSLDPAVPGSSSCAYSGPVSGPLAQVEIYVGDGAKQYLDTDRGIGIELTPIADLGDEAYAELVQNVIFFRVSGLWVAIRVVRLNDPAENNAPLEALGRQVAAKL